MYRSLNVNERINLKGNFAKCALEPEHLLSPYYIVAMRDFAIHNQWGKNMKCAYRCIY